MPQRNLGLQGFPYLVQPYGEGDEKPTDENHISDEAGTLVPRPPKPRRKKRVHECKPDGETPNQAMKSPTEVKPWRNKRARWLSFIRAG